MLGLGGELFRVVDGALYGLLRSMNDDLGELAERMARPLGAFAQSRVVCNFSDVVELGFHGSRSLHVSYRMVGEHLRLTFTLPGKDQLIVQHPMTNERILRNVLTLAREVRIQMRDRSVIYATVVSSDASVFLVRPWGASTTIALRFEAVSSARPVRMGWQQQRVISAAQFARSMLAPIASASAR